MAVTQRLDLRQSQSLVMTPQLQQAIKLLQLTNIELAAYVEQELEQNPLLKRDDGEDGAGADGDHDAADPTDPVAVNGEMAASGTLDLAAGDGIAVSTDAPLDTDYDNMWNGESDGPAYTPAAGGGGGEPLDERSYEQTLFEAPTLRGHLLEQVEADFEDPAERLAASALIDMIDERGYLARDDAEIAAALGTDPETVANIVARLQKMDPPGIFARDLAECLALQLADRNRLDPAIQTLLDNLDLLAKHDLAGLKRRCGVDDDDLRDMIDEIRRLNPKPATAFETEVAQPVTPDILLRRLPDGTWEIELNTETLPRVLVDNRYYATVRQMTRGKADKEYIAERYQTANWLVKALHQRATTILRVSREIVRQQEMFFLHGVNHLRPMVLRDIAEALDMHESTVSRVTNGKFMASPRGIFELRYFFSAAISHMAGGAAHSAESVRHRIKALIDAEAPDAVLSDDALVDRLRADGVDIARRTVAKYREAMKIPSSVQRRRQKMAALRA